MIKILLLGTNLNTGGAQRVLLNLAGWLHRHSIPVQAVFMYDRDGLAKSWQAAYPFPILCLNAWKKDAAFLQRMWLFIPGWLNLVRWMRQERFSAVLTFTHDGNLIGLPAAWLAGIPIRFGSDHNRYPSLTNARLHVHRWIINSFISHGLVAVSGFTKTQALEEGIRPDRVHVIHNGVDPGRTDASRVSEIRREMLPSGQGHIVLTVGRLVPQKAQHILVRAAAIVLKSFPRTVFCLAGDGPQRVPLQELVDKLSLGRSVRILGDRDDIPELMAASDLFVLSSSSEGLPVALLEAMASGVAVVSTAIGGVADAILEDETGLLAPVDDSEGLANVICRALDDDSLRSRLSAAGKTRVENEFSLDAMGEHYLKLLSSK